MSRDERNEYNNMLRDHGQVPGIPPLPPTPAEVSGFEGWREEDDAYWEDFRGRQVSFRAPTCHTSDDLQPPPQPLDRHGNPSQYPAAVQYDYERGEWVPTSEEEEELLRNPWPVIDPFFVAEAADDEMHTTLVPSAEEGHRVVHDFEEGEDRDVVIDFSGCMLPPIDLTLHRRKALGMKPGSWRVVHLGTSSAVPTSKRNVSSTAMIIMPQSERDNAEPSMFLVDAGENTDDQLIRCDWCMTHGFRWIRAIFITHLHGDHIYGLPALLINIGRFAQHRRRLAMEGGEEMVEPVIQIFGPYGTRGFLRTSLYWTNPVGVQFSVAELVPRPTDFIHLRKFSERYETKKTFIVDREDDGELTVSSERALDVSKQSPPPHPEEVRTEDVHVSSDGLWHLWTEGDQGVKVEVVAAPLQHRLPCFGYVFRERFEANGVDERPAETESRSMSHTNGVARCQSNGAAVNGAKSPDTLEIDKLKAKELGVHGTQLRVLRSGRPITVTKTGLVVHPHDVLQTSSEKEQGTVQAPKFSDAVDKKSSERFRRKVTVLGDTCDSRLIQDAAMDSDLLVHEATFTQALRGKAKVSMHSTARMAGAFGRQIKARKVALTHFSSRLEMLHGGDDVSEKSTEGNGSVNGEPYGDGVVDEENDEEEDLVSPNLLVREALQGYGRGEGNIVAAKDFMEHDIIPFDSSDENEGKVMGESYKINVEASQAV